MGKKQSQENSADDKKVIKPISAHELRTNRILSLVAEKIKHETHSMQNIIEQKKQLIKNIIKTAISNNLFDKKIYALWEALLSRALSDKANIPEIDDLIGTDAKTIVKRSYSGNTQIGERRFFINQVYYSIATYKRLDPKEYKVKSKAEYNDNFKIYFFYLWFDKIKEKKILTQLECLNDKIFSLNEKIRDVHAQIEEQHELINMRPAGPVTLVKMGPTIKDAVLIDYETAMHNLTPVITKEHDNLFNNPLGFEDEKRLYLQIDTSYDKKEILQQIDDLVGVIQRLQGRKRGKGTKKSVKKEELEALIEEMFLRFYVKERISAEKSFDKISEHLEVMGIKLDSASIAKRYVPRIKNKYDITNIKSLRQSYYDK